jgi:hypothetical protein
VPAATYFDLDAAQQGVQLRRRAAIARWNAAVLATLDERLA